MSDHPKLFAVEYDFLITRDIWTGGLEEFLLDHVEEKHRSLVLKKRQAFDERESPVFLDHEFRGYSYLGDIVCNHSREEMPETIRGYLMTMSWMADSFVLRVIFQPAKGVNDIDRIPADWLSQKPTDFRELLCAASNLSENEICQWYYLVDNTLTGIRNLDDFTAWTKTHPLKQIGRFFGELSPPTQILQMLLPSPIQFNWKFAEFPLDNLPIFSPEVESAIKYHATMLEFSKPIFRTLIME